MDAHRAVVDGPGCGRHRDVSKSRTLHANSLRGLGSLTARELRHLYGPAVDVVGSERSRNLDVTRFAYSGHLPDLQRVGTAEDLFATICQLPLTGIRQDLEAVRRAAHRGGVAQALEARIAFGARRSKRVSFRAVVQATDADWRRYRRSDLQRAWVGGICEQYPRWRAVDEDADLEFWIQQLGRCALIGLRLSDSSMRHRTYKTAHMPGSLRPTVARAMAFAAGWEADDVAVDPVCGAGTVLIERALLARHGALLGGDIQLSASRDSLENFGRQHRPRIVCQWNAAALPLRDGVADRVLGNLPWGMRIQADLDSLYAGVLRETARILKPQGTGAFLTSRSGLFEGHLRRTADLSPGERIRDISVLGRMADLLVVRKGA